MLQPGLQVEGHRLAATLPLREQPGGPACPTAIDGMFSSRWCLCEFRYASVEARQRLSLVLGSRVFVFSCFEDTVKVSQVNGQ